MLPGHVFRCVDALLSSGRYPGTALLALVFAVGGEALVRSAYRHALANEYRFLSYGDAMLIV